MSKKRNSVEPGEEESFSEYNDMEVSEDINTELEESSNDAAVVGEKNRSASRKTAKELALSRKKQKTGGDLVPEVKALWEQGRQAVADNDKAERDRIVASLMTMCKGRMHDLIFKHDSSRVVQFMIKSGKDDDRICILEELKPHLYDLAFSKYGRFVITKFLKYVAASRALIREALLKSPYSVKKTVLNREASEILEEVFTQFSNMTQKTELVSNLFGPEHKLIAKDKPLPPSILSHILEITQASINKGTFGYSSVVHLGLLIALKNVQDTGDATKVQKFVTDLVEILKDQFVHILHLKFGSTLVMQLLPYCSIKIRKVFAKECKPVLLKIVGDEHGYLALVTLLDLTDDTVMTGKHIVSELSLHIKECMENPYGKRVLMYLVSGGFSSNFFNASVVSQLDALYKLSSSLGNTKKDKKTRSNELFEEIKGPFYKYWAAEIVRNEESLMQILADPASASLLQESLNLIDESCRTVSSMAFSRLFEVLSSDMNLLAENKAVSLFLNRTLTKSSMHVDLCKEASSSLPKDFILFLLKTCPLNELFGIKIAAYLLHFGHEVKKPKLSKEETRRLTKSLETIKKKLQQQNNDIAWISWAEKLLS